MPHTPAYPITEATRHVVTPGITVHELYTLHLLAAQVAALGLQSIDQAHIDAAKSLADMALAHRIGGAA